MSLHLYVGQRKIPSFFIIHWRTHQNWNFPTLWCKWIFKFYNDKDTWIEPHRASTIFSGSPVTIWSRKWTPAFFQKFLQVNSEFLLKACAQENMEMVKVFIKYNCHLTITHEDWRSDLNPLGFDIIPTENNQNVKVLDMMATKAYIFGCYQAMLEIKGIQDCIC